MADSFFIESKKINFEGNIIILVQGFHGKKEMVLEKNKIWYIPSILLMELLNKSYLNFSDIEKIVAQIPILDNSKSEIKQSFMKISKVFENTNSIVSKMNEFYEMQDKMTLVLKLLDLYFKKQNLIKEKNWASFFEIKSKESSKLKRIDALTNKISELEKKIKSEEPEYQFMKKRIEDLTIEKSILKKESLSSNKIYVEKTRGFNKIRRNMDELNDSLEIYNQKIEELGRKIKNKDNLQQNEDYIRILKKKDGIKSQLDSLNEEKTGLAIELKRIKDNILHIKQKSTEINSNISKIQQKFKISEESYLNLLEQLDSGKNQLNQIRNELIQIEQRDSDKTSLNEKPEGEKPSIIRYSKIIESEIVETDNSTIQLCHNLNLTKKGISDKIILQLFEDIENQIKFLTTSNISMDFNLQELLSIIKTIQVKIDEFRKIFNSFLRPIDITFKISRIPVSFLKDDAEVNQKLDQEINDTFNNFGYLFSFLDRDKKELKFEKLKKQTKLFILMMSIAAINAIFGVSNNYFFEDEIDPKLVSKGTLKKIITILNKFTIKKFLNIKNRYIILTKKIKLEKNEFQDLKRLKILDLNDISLNN